MKLWLYQKKSDVYKPKSGERERERAEFAYALAHIH